MVVAVCFRDVDNQSCRNTIFTGSFAGFSNVVRVWWGVYGPGDVGEPTEAGRPHWCSAFRPGP